MPVAAFQMEVEDVAYSYEEVARRVEDPRPAFREVLGLLESEELRHFDRMRGRYVLSGATRASLTQPTANGAIREIHVDGVRFGSRIDTVRYLTKAPKDTDDGQIRKQHGFSAVMVFSRVTKRKAAELVLDYVAEPYG